MVDSVSFLPRSLNNEMPAPTAHHQKKTNNRNAHSNSQLLGNAKQTYKERNYLHLDQTYGSFCAPQEGIILPLFTSHHGLCGCNLGDGTSGRFTLVKWLLKIIYNLFIWQIKKKKELNSCSCSDFASVLAACTESFWNEVR